MTRDAGDVGVDVAEEARRVGETGADQQGPGQRPGDVDRSERHRPVEDVDAEAPRVDPVADPHLGVGRAAGRERQHEARLRLAQDHPVVHDVAALVEQQRVARPAGLDVRDVAGVEPFEELDDVRPGDDQLAERADVADRDALADGPVLRDRVAVVPRPPPATEPVHPRPEREVLVVERRPPEGVDVAVGGGLGQRDLAGRRAGRERLGHLAGRAAIHDRTCGRQAPPWHGPRPAWLARLSSSSSVKPRSQAPARSATVVPMQPTDDALGRWRGKRLVGGRRADRRSSRHGAGHPCQESRGGRPRPTDDRVGGRRRLGASRRIRGHDGADAAARSPSNRTRRTVDRRTARRRAASRSPRPAQATPAACIAPRRGP